MFVLFTYFLITMDAVQSLLTSAGDCGRCRKAAVDSISRCTKCTAVFHKSCAKLVPGVSLLDPKGDTIICGAHAVTIDLNSTIRTDDTTSSVIDDLRAELAAISAERNKFAAENSLLKSQLSQLTIENKSLKASSFGGGMPDFYKFKSEVLEKFAALSDEISLIKSAGLSASAASLPGAVALSSVAAGPRGAGGNRLGPRDNPRVVASRGVPAAVRTPGESAASAVSAASVEPAVIPAAPRRRPSVASGGGPSAGPSSRPLAPDVVDNAGSDDGFQVVQGRRRRRVDRSVHGAGATSLPLTGIVRRHQLHLWGLVPSTTPEMIVEYMKSLNRDVQCFRLKSRLPDEYSSFRLSCRPEDVAALREPDIWPCGARIDRYYGPT